MTKIKRSLLLVVLFAATGCNSVKEELGVGRNSPDEFTVVKRAPLTLPPDYTLRPPVDGSLRPSSDAPIAARETLLGKAENPVSVQSADAALLEKMGATRADPNIRETVNRDNGILAKESRTIADKLIFWKNEAPRDDKAPASVVDARAEAERLKKNRDEGKPVNTGKVPTIEKKRGTLDKIF